MVLNSNIHSISRFISSLFVWLISYQPAVFFYQNKPATTNQPAILFSQESGQISISNQPPAKRTGSR
jgi:hypothetical protein